MSLEVILVQDEPYEVAMNEIWPPMTTFDDPE
jgi:hypothetical protein